MATPFTSTSSALIANTFNSRNSVIIRNTGAGTLNVVIGQNTTAEVASSTNYTVSIVSGAYWESPPGVVGIYSGIFLTAGTAYITEASNRLN